jgi:hypothetical protein
LCKASQWFLCSISSWFLVEPLFCLVFVH